MEVPVNFYRSYGEQHKTCSMLVVLGTKKLAHPKIISWGLMGIDTRC